MRLEQGCYLHLQKYFLTAEVNLPPHPRRKPKAKHPAPLQPFAFQSVLRTDRAFDKGRGFRELASKKVSYYLESTLIKILKAEKKDTVGKE
ncbi:hypothetical protein BCY86_00195 [Pajaroellobacter abortibovis]|uniref:Uncharacterized protein n=1 Tax=Pajaroellobacter abortibovis TaxID=1882918 RepID=A0A1L6MUV1_9BACT|nr:hypothetical protein BCY86_00195 [Pajaroellobacter abortibovis]